MPIRVRCLPAALLVLAAWPTLAATPMSYRLSCAIDFGKAEPTVQVYVVDPAARTLLAEPRTLYTLTGESMVTDTGAVSLRIIDRWDGDIVEARWTFTGADGNFTISFETTFDLKRLTLVTNRGQTGTCERVT